MPSVLVETGFITNPTEEKYLNSKEGQDYLASAIFRACRDYLSEIGSKSGILTEKKPDSDEKSDTLTEVNQPAGETYYMVQVKTSSSKTEIKPENFKGLKDIKEMNALDHFKYVTGSFTNYSDAVQYRKKIELVYPDAFVIAVKDNKIVPLQQALDQKKQNDH